MSLLDLLSDSAQLSVSATATMSRLPSLHSDTSLLKGIKAIISMDSCDSTRSKVNAGVTRVAQSSSERDLSSSKRGGGAGFSSSLIAGSLVKRTGPRFQHHHRRREADLERLVCRVPGD